MKEIVTSSHNNPLIWFEDLIQNGGINKCYEKFIVDKEMLTGQFTSPDNLEYFFSEQNEYGEITSIKIPFSQNLNQELSKAYEKTILLLSNQIANFNSLDDLKAKLIFNLNSIVYLHQLVSEIKAYHQDVLIEWWLFKIIKFIKDKYGTAIVTHNAYDLLNKEHETNYPHGFFGFKYSQPELRKLFKLVLIELELFTEEDENCETNFMKIFLAEHPENLNITLRINCTVGKASYIFDCMEQYFYNLKDISIINSKSFKKHRYILTQGGLQKARSKYRKDVSKDAEREEIDKIFKDFKIAKR